MLEIRRYTPDRADEWNQFVTQSKNGTFLFDRRYMDYHANRFEDYSLMFYDENGLLALLPANRVDDRIVSHQGLTYGGLVMSERATTGKVCELFSELNKVLRQNGIRRVEYKPVPWIYHRLPSEEDLYALFIECKATLVGRDVSSAIMMNHPVKWRRDRRYGANKAATNGVIVEQSDDYAAFWQVLTKNLMDTYGVKPVHSLEEIMLLRARFPEYIRLYVAKYQEKVVGGTVIFHCVKTVHSQYISASVEGKRLHAVDALYERILKHDYKDASYFDFGKSTLKRGYGLNVSLIYQKEGFGARAVCYDTYEWEVKSER